MFTNGTVPKTVGQVAELVGDVVKFLIKFLSALSGSDLQILISRKKKLFDGIKKAVEDVLGKASDTHDFDLILEWKKFYSEALGIDVDLSGLVIPTKPDGDWWLIVVMPGITYSHVIAKLRALFNVWTYVDDLDKVIDMTKEQRRATDASYAVWVRATMEADPENANKSANDLAGTPQITLMERLLLEGVYFKRTGKHLDIDNITLCAGSRRSDGYVPDTYWDADGDELCVDWYSVGYRFDDLRSRSVSC